MKKILLILAMTGLFFSFHQVKSQNYSNTTIFDTVNVRIGENQLDADRDIYVGKIQVNDPENDNITYEISFQEHKGLFAIDSDNGVITANRRFLSLLCGNNAFKVEVTVSDGTNDSSGYVVIYTECRGSRR